MRLGVDQFGPVLGALLVNLVRHGSTGEGQVEQVGLDIQFHGFTVKVRPPALRRLSRDAVRLLGRELPIGHALRRTRSGHGAQIKVGSLGLNAPHRVRVVDAVALQGHRHHDVARVVLIRAQVIVVLAEQVLPVLARQAGHGIGDGAQGGELVELALIGAGQVVADVAVDGLRQVVNRLVGIGGHAGAFEGARQLEQKFVLRRDGITHRAGALQAAQGAGGLVDVEAIGAGIAGRSLQAGGRAVAVDLLRGLGIDLSRLQRLGSAQAVAPPQRLKLIGQGHAAAALPGHAPQGIFGFALAARRRQSRGGEPRDALIAQIGGREGPQLLDGGQQHAVDGIRPLRAPAARRLAGSRSPVARAAAAPAARAIVQPGATQQGAEVIIHLPLQGRALQSGEQLGKIGIERVAAGA